MNRQDVTNPAIVEAVPPYQAKLDATKYLEKVAGENPTTSWTAVINGPFYDWVGSTLHPISSPLPLIVDNGLE